MALAAETASASSKTSPSIPLAAAPPLSTAAEREKYRSFDALAG